MLVNMRSFNSTMSTEANQSLRQGEFTHAENFLFEGDMASGHVLPQDMAPWSPTTSSVAASEIRTHGNLTSTPSSISVSSSDTRPALFAASAPRLPLRSALPAIPSQGVALANSLNRFHLQVEQQIVQILGDLTRPVLNQEHLRIRTPPHDLSSSPLHSQRLTPVVRSQASQFPGPVTTIPRGTSLEYAPLAPVVRSQRDPWMSWINTQAANSEETWSQPEVHSPDALSAALANILMAAPSQRPGPVANNVSQSHFGFSSLFPGPGGPSSSGSRSSCQTVVKGMKAGTSVRALYDEVPAFQWEYRSRPVEIPAVDHVDVDYDDYINGDDDDDDDSFEVSKNERENDSGCDIGGSNDNDRGDQDGHDDHDDHDDDKDDDEPQMSAVAWDKRHAVSPSSSSRVNKGNHRTVPTSPSFFYSCSSSPSPSYSSEAEKKLKQTKTDTQPRRPKDTSGRDPRLFPFDCPDCPGRFRKWMNLDRHCENHLPHPVQCLNCGRRLSRADAMKRHAVSKRFRACLAFGWFAERELILGTFPETSSSSPSKAGQEEEDTSSQTAPADAPMNTSAGYSTSESSSSAEEASLSQLPEQYPEDGSPVVYGEPGNWFTIRNGVRLKIDIAGSFRVRACFPEWYFPRTPRNPGPSQPPPEDPLTPRPRKRAGKEQNEKEDKKKRRDDQE